MELNKLIPDNNSNWIVNNNQLLYTKLINIPICFIEDGIIYVFLENKLPRQIIKLTQHLIDLNVEFYFLPPKFSHPGNIFDNSDVIRHYFYTYINKKFYDGFNNIEFDLIHNLIKWCDINDSYLLVKDIFTEVNKLVQDRYYDFYQDKYRYRYPEIIREEFNSLYRDIQINKIL